MSGSPANRLQTQILEQLTELKSRVEESLQQGRENGSELKMLRRELGLDGPHGRLPIAEATLMRHELRMEKMEVRIDVLDAGTMQATGRAKFIATAMSLIGGSAGGAVIALLAHWIGAR